MDWAAACFFFLKRVHGWLRKGSKAYDKLYGPWQGAVMPHPEPAMFAGSLHVVLETGM